MKIRQSYKNAWHVVIKCEDYRFDAVCTNGYNLSIQSNMQDALQFGNSSVGVAFGLNRILNTAPFFDYSLKYAFMGMQPVTFTIECVLPLIPEKGLDSFTKPLQNLAKICLPARGASLADALSKLKAASTQASSEYIKDLAGITTEGAANLIGFISSTTGFDLHTASKEIYTVVIPEQVTKNCIVYFGSKDDGNYSSRIENVLIQGVTLSFGTPTVTLDGKKTYPSYISLNLTCMYGRVPTDVLVKGLVN